MSVRWGFLGAGAVASRLTAPAVHYAAGAELYAVAARAIDRASRLQPNVAVASYDELLRDDDVDAVYIALPNDAHARWTIAALEAGKHVLCEKPLALSADEVNEMTAAAQRADRLLVEALFYRWHPQVRLVEQLIAEGRIGTVRYVTAGFSFNGVATDNYRWDPDRGGGAVYDVGCYPLSAALWAFGFAPVREVTAKLLPGQTGVDLTADITVHFDNGDAEIHVGMDEPPRQWLRIAGDEGAIELPDRPFSAWFGDDADVVVDGKHSTVPATDPYRVMIENVSAAIRGESGYVVPLAESLRTATLVDAAFAAAGN